MLLEESRPSAQPNQALPVRVARRLGNFAQRVLYARLERLLSRRRADVWVIAIAIVLASTSLFCGIGADDHIHRLSLKGSNAIDGFQRAPFDLFRFATPESNLKLMNQGIFPWWADPQARLAFFRPLTSLSHALDHWLWPESAFAAHLQSLCWFLFGLLGLRVLYEAVIRERWVAVLALFFYALDDARGGPLTWLANRNAMIASACSIWALAFFHLWRARGSKLSAWLAPVALAAGLLAAEGAIAIFGYLLAYAIYLDRGSWRARLLHLLPCIAVVLAWRVLAQVLRYGSIGSGVYLDPFVEPKAFIFALVERMPALLLGQIAGPWSEIWNAVTMFSPLLGRLLWAVALLAISATIVLLRPLWRADRSLRFWVVGALLATMPPCATFPADRLLSWVAIGASAALAMLFAALLHTRSADTKPADTKPARSGPAPWSPVMLELALLTIVFFHVVLGPLTLPWRATGIIAVRESLERADRSLPRSAEIAQQTFVYLNPPVDPFASYIPIMRADRGETRPLTQRWLATGTSDVVLSRVDAHTLRVRQIDGFLRSPSEKMLRSPSRPLGVGSKVSLTGMTVTITTATEDHRPLEALVRFDLPLEHPSLRWFQWVEDGYTAFVPPPIGKTILVPKVDFLKVAYGRDE